MCGEMVTHGNMAELQQKIFKGLGGGLHDLVATFGVNITAI